MERSDCGYDFDEQEYLKDYQRFLEEIRKVVVGLTKVYSVTMIKAILTMWVCEGSVSDRLKTQYSNNVLLLDALLTILSSFNRGISANKVNVKAKQELIGTGRDIVQQFLAFPLHHPLPHELPLGAAAGPAVTHGLHHAPHFHAAERRLHVRVGLLRR